MISISKEEAKAMRDNLPEVHIVRTVKQKSNRGRYFCDESRRAIRFLERLRGKSLNETKAGD